MDRENRNKNVTVEIKVDGLLYEFYKKVGENVKKSPDEVMADALYKFAELFIR